MSSERISFKELMHERNSIINRFVTMNVYVCNCINLLIKFKSNGEVQGCFLSIFFYIFIYGIQWRSKEPRNKICSINF